MLEGGGRRYRPGGISHPGVVTEDTVRSDSTALLVQIVWEADTKMGLDMQACNKEGKVMNEL
jgi:hypothetical protein